MITVGTVVLITFVAFLTFAIYEWYMMGEEKRRTLENLRAQRRYWRFRAREAHKDRLKATSNLGIKTTRIMVRVADERVIQIDEEIEKVEKLGVQKVKGPRH